MGYKIVLKRDAEDELQDYENKRNEILKYFMIRNEEILWENQS